MSIETLTNTILNQMPKMPKRSRVFFFTLNDFIAQLTGTLHLCEPSALWFIQRGNLSLSFCQSL